MSDRTTHTFETTDLYEAAYLSSKAFNLVELYIKENALERHAVFTFEGDRDAFRATARTYFCGDAIVNLSSYRYHLEQMKDRMFKALRRHKQRAAMTECQRDQS